ncbi:MAG TPA: multicopper oxidase domain-containing protein [Myxococcaceae bacterium]|nr:multicopper oxidase domain-containing protein [Myxococcaceae bacterium]
MSISRRKLLRGVGAGLVWTVGTRGWGADSTSLPTTPPKGMKLAAPVPHAGMKPIAPLKNALHPQTLPRFVDPLPLPPVARSTGTRAAPDGAKGPEPLYRMVMQPVETQVHRDLQPTRWWSYGGSVPGPTFETRSGQGLWVEWVNQLPTKHFLPIDQNLCGCGPGVPEVRTVPHVHGARVPASSDGYPEKWFTPGRSALFHYPNRQDAATLWYHDHAMGIERLNQYAGLFGTFLVRDPVEASRGLPSGAQEIPLVFFDRLFDQAGQIQYLTSGMPDAPWVSEMYGDALLVNGKLAPYLDVEPRLHRFRMINASNSRFLYFALGGIELVQIGSDQGLLAAPVRLKSLTLSPGERADVLVDFGPMAGKQVVLNSQAFQLMQFRVGGSKPEAPAPVPAALREIPRTPVSAAVKTRRLSLNEYEDPKTHAMLMLLNGTYWREPVTEKPVLDTVEIWELYNFTGDVHPIHLHLVRFQLLDRQHFDIDAFNYEHQMKLKGPQVPPLPNEMGWKDTIQAHPEMITRIIVRFEGYAGRYVWHCHVLEHAANEMMRPFEVVARKHQARAG